MTALMRIVQFPHAMCQVSGQVVRCPAAPCHVPHVQGQKADQQGIGVTGGGRQGKSGFNQLLFYIN